MSLSSQPLRSTVQTIVDDTRSAIEIPLRLNLSRALTQKIDKARLTLSAPKVLHDVLDIGCGPGAWIFDMASRFPQAQFVGVDTHRCMIDYAREQAQMLCLRNVTFYSLRDLSLSHIEDASFDMVNVRSLFDCIHKHDWQVRIREGYRLLRSGGVFQLMESDLGESNAPTHEFFFRIYAESMSSTDSSFSPFGRGLGILPLLLPSVRKAGFVHVRGVDLSIDYSSDTEIHDAWCRDLMIWVNTMLPMLAEQGRYTLVELKRIAELMQEQLDSPHFAARWPYTLVVGEKPS